MKASATRGKPRVRAAQHVELATIARLGNDEVLSALDTTAAGLAAAEARARLLRFGRNTIASEPRRVPLLVFLRQFSRPLPILLLALAGVDFATGQVISAFVIVVIVSLSSLLGFIQEHRSDRAEQRLRAMVRTTARVLRSDAGKSPGSGRTLEIALEELVPGDLVLLSAGDPIPAEVRFIEATDLFIDQSSLTGESFPVAKQADPATAPRFPSECTNLGFMGTHVISGSARAVVIATGGATSFGRLAASLIQKQERSDFDRGIDSVVNFLLRCMAVMAPLVLLLNWATKGDGYQALLFATSVAVGLAPELLPMIVSVNLARGALALVSKEIIVKRLGAVQTLGAIDVLCTDKTGTLTQDRVILEKHVDIFGNNSELVIDYAYLNSYHQTGLKNLLDSAVLSYSAVHARLKIDEGWRKVTEIPFDFQRRRMSVVLARPDGKHVLICKGAVEEIMNVCGSAELGTERMGFATSHAEALSAVVRDLNADGLRVIAIAYRTLSSSEQPAADPRAEHDLTLVGYIAFLDPPKDSAARAIAALKRHGIAVKVLSGDNAAVCAHVCRLVGIDADAAMDGAQVDQLNDAELGQAAVRTNVFAKLTPEHKTRVIRCMQQQGRIVGFLGDGVNDGPALKRADVGISVDTGTDIARESADLIMLQKSLLALDDGVIIGRTVFGNIIKYIRMSASSNFGNMLSVLGASVLLPFLPMAPVQILLNNLLYDCSQTALTTDRVDHAYLLRPRRWEIDNIRRYVLCFGPISSLFDYATFALLWFGLQASSNAALFQTGWFVESLLSQTLVVHIIRTCGLPFGDNRPSTLLLAATLMVCGIGVWLPWSALAAPLGFAPPPAPYWWGLSAILIAYATVIQLAKAWLIRRFGVG
jgi:Mg2+-importing ATPase